MKIYASRDGSSMQQQLNSPGRHQLIVAERYSRNMNFGSNSSGSRQNIGQNLRNSAYQSGPMSGNEMSKLSPAGNPYLRSNRKVARQAGLRNVTKNKKLDIIPSS